MGSALDENLVSLLADVSLINRTEQVRKVDTPYGGFTVTVVGDPKLPPLVTVHDIGLNHESNFNSFFNKPEVRRLADNFCTIHVDVPGQESGAGTLGEAQTSATYPTIEKLVSGLEFVLTHCGISSFTGFGYGAGAYVLSLVALSKPELVSSLVLINASGERAIWTYLTYMRRCAAVLRAGGLTRSVQDYLRWYHCGREEGKLSNLFSTFDDHIASQNPKNLADWMEAYNKRPSLGLQRPINSLQCAERNFRCPVLLVVGRQSPHLEETRKMFGQCDPRLASFLELPDCRTPLDECPTEVVEAMAVMLRNIGCSPTKSQQVSIS